MTKEDHIDLIYKLIIFFMVNTGLQEVFICLSKAWVEDPMTWELEISEACTNKQPNKNKTSFFFLQANTDTHTHKIHIILRIICQNDAVLCQLYARARHIVIQISTDCPPTAHHRQSPSLPLPLHTPTQQRKDDAAKRSDTGNSIFILTLLLPSLPSLNTQLDPSLYPLYFIFFIFFPIAARE